MKYITIPSILVFFFTSVYAQNNEFKSNNYLNVKDTFKMESQHSFFSKVLAKAHFDSITNIIDIYIYNFSTETIVIPNIFSSDANFDYADLVKSNCDTSFKFYYIDMNLEILERKFSSLRDFKVNYSDIFLTSQRGVHLTFANYSFCNYSNPPFELILYYYKHIIYIPKGMDFKLFKKNYRLVIQVED